MSKREKRPKNIAAKEQRLIAMGVVFVGALIAFIVWMERGF